MKVLIEVTQEDIEKGQRGMFLFCPISLAMQRLGIEDPMVMGSVIHVGESEGEGFIPTPAEAKTFVEEFDRGATVEPFSFEIDLPTPNQAVEESPR